MFILMSESISDIVEGEQGTLLLPVSQPFSVSPHFALLKLSISLSLHISHSIPPSISLTTHFRIQFQFPLSFHRGFRCHFIFGTSLNDFIDSDASISLVIFALYFTFNFTVFFWDVVSIRRSFSLPEFTVTLIATFDANLNFSFNRAVDTNNFAFHSTFDFALSFTFHLFNISLFDFPSGVIMCLSPILFQFHFPASLLSLVGRPG